MVDHVTSLLELFGLLLLVAAAALWAGSYNLPAGVAVAGFGLIGSSALLTWRARR